MNKDSKLFTTSAWASLAYLLVMLLGLVLFVSGMFHSVGGGFSVPFGWSLFDLLLLPAFYSLVRLGAKNRSFLLTITGWVGMLYAITSAAWPLLMSNGAISQSFYTQLLVAPAALGTISFMLVGAALLTYRKRYNYFVLTGGIVITFVSVLFVTLLVLATFNNSQAGGITALAVVEILVVWMSILHIYLTLIAAFLAPVLFKESMTVGKKS